MANVTLRGLGVTSSRPKSSQQTSKECTNGNRPRKLFQRIRPRFGKIGSAFQKFMGGALKRGSSLTSRTTISADTITEIDYPAEAEMMFAVQPEHSMPDNSSLDIPAGLHTRGGNNAVALACPPVSDEPVLILSSLSRYAEHPEASLESPIDDTNVSRPLSLALITTRQLSCTKPFVQSRTSSASDYVGAQSRPSPKRSTSQHGHTPNGCDVWIRFYIFPHIIISVMIFPTYGFGVMMWRYIRPASKPRTRAQPSPPMDFGAGRYDEATTYSNSAATVAHLFGDKPTLYLTGLDPEAAIVSRAHPKRVVAISTPHVSRTSITRAYSVVGGVRSASKSVSKSIACIRTAQLLSISAQILSILLIWNLWAS